MFVCLLGGVALASVHVIIWGGGGGGGGSQPPTVGSKRQFVVGCT